jgi:hypothetical protein
MNDSEARGTPPAWTAPWRPESASGAPETPAADEGPQLAPEGPMPLDTIWEPAPPFRDRHPSRGEERGGGATEREIAARARDHLYT